MCETCTDRYKPRTAPVTPVAERLIPLESGEAAIYSPEYLARKEERTHGRAPELLPPHYRY